MTDAIKKYEADIQGGLVAQAAGVRIDTDKDYQEAALAARQIKSTIEEIEETRKRITQPMNEALDNTNAIFKSVKEKYVLAEKILKEKLAKYLLDAKQQEAEIVANSDSHDALAVVGLAAPVASGIAPRTYYDFEVVDEAQVPEVFRPRVLDAKAIRAYLRATKGKSPIAGLKIVEKNTVAVSKSKG